MTGHNIALREKSTSPVAVALAGTSHSPRPHSPLGSGKSHLHVAASVDFDDHTITTNSGDDDLQSPSYPLPPASVAPLRTHGQTQGQVYSAAISSGSVAASANADSLKNSAVFNTAKFGRRGNLTQAQAVGAADHYSRWMDRSDSNLVALIYGFMTLVIKCGKLPELEQAEVTENVTLITFLKAQKSSFFTVLLATDTQLRSRLLSFLKDNFSVLSLYSELLGEILAVFSYCIF